MKKNLLTETRFKMRKITKKNLLTVFLIAAITNVILLGIYYLSPIPPVCYFDREWNDGKTLVNYEKNQKLQRNAANMFFHETSCTEDGIIKLTSRQACAIESAGEEMIKYLLITLFLLLFYSF